ncbi:hypothetical protein BGX26_008242 [Mortierella sp. AD094]|nr:hypothetical protein BGX26_008242 [Mortierella sp. AD094]
MDVLNAVESVQSILRGLLEKNGTKGRQSERQEMEVRVMSLYLLHCLYSYLPIQQNPFLCLFVDIYNVASQDDKLRSERFVTSVILNGNGEELAPKTPSELIALAQKVESKPVNLRMLEEYLPEVPIEDQVKVGLGWDSQQKQRGDKKRVWETFTTGGGSRHGDESDHSPITLPASSPSNDSRQGVKENIQNGTVTVSTAPAALTEKQEEEEEELEEWEIEAERRFQDSDVDDAPSLPSPASKKAPTSRPKAAVVAAVVAAAAAAAVVTEPVVTKKISPALEQAANATAGDQDQVKRRRKLWPRK